MKYYSRKVNRPFADVLAATIQSLQHEGFTIAATVDMAQTCKRRLQVSFRNYTLVTVYHPQLTYEAISLESHMGVMATSNVVVQEHENGEVEISALSPLASLDENLRITYLNELDHKMEQHLRNALDIASRDASHNVAATPWGDRFTKVLLNAEELPD